MSMEKKLADALRDLLEVAERAIESNDWVVDGACDPDSAIFQAHRALGTFQAQKVSSISRQAGDKR